MKVEYMRTAKKSYMIVKEADFPYEPYELSMVLRNDIACLIPFQVILEDGKAQYWYDVGGMQAVKTAFLMKSPDGKQIRLLLESLAELKAAMEAYLLDDENICFSAEMVCFDRSRERIRFCYIPGLSKAEEGSKGRGLKELFEYILQQLDHSDPAAVRMAYEMYERCARGPFAAEDCMDCLRLGDQAAPDRPRASVGEQDILWRSARDTGSFVRNKGGGEEGAAAAENQDKHKKRALDEFTEETDTERQDPRDENEDDLEFLFEEPVQRMGHRRKRKRGRADRIRESGPRENMRPAGDPGYSEDDSRTEIISEDFTVKTWELVYKGKGVESDLAVADFPFLIGTDNSRVDGLLHARTVSRVHAKLFIEEGSLFVEDFNSTNGTYLNNELLPMNTPAKLSEGDRIVFATEEYVLFSRHTAAM